MASPFIRPPRANDVEAVAALLGELGYPASPDAVRSRLATLAAHPGIAAFVSELEEAVVGLATAYVIPAVHADRVVGVLSALVVTAGQRRRGIGRQLVEAAQAWARERDAYRMTVSTGLARADAHAFYESLGYAHTSRRYSLSFEGSADGRRP